MYLTTEDLTQAFSKTTLAQLSNDEPRATEPNEVVLQQAVQSACERIDSALRSRYRLPLSEVPTVIHIHLRGGARYTLYYEDEVVITFEGGDYNWQKEVSSSDVRRHHLPVLTNYDASLAPKTMRQALMDEIAANQISYQKIGDWDVRRYPDGTMIQTCRHRRGGAEFNRGHDDASNFVTLMYPLAFVESPTLTVTAQLSHPYAKDGLFTNDKSGRLGSGTVEANDGIVGLTVDCNNQQCQYTYTNGNTYISEMTFNITAIGRYKV